MALQKSNVTAVRNEGRDRAVGFVHGFNGAQDDTWDRFPALLGSATHHLDIFTIGYATTLLPDVVGVWSADPDLPILATMLCTELAIKPFDCYKSLTLIAHSMGGLVVQKALVDDPGLAARMQHVILFGSPSAGLRKASAFQFWKRQLKNMAFDSAFISSLRADWKRLFGATPPFNLVVVAGTSDQFVPSESSLGPFEKSMQRALPGDHISIVKPASADAPSVALVVATLTTGNVPARDRAADLRLAAEQPNKEALALVKSLDDMPGGGMSAKEIVDAALALDRAGRRNDSIVLLQRHQNKATDIKGTLGGRYKRLWFDSGDRQYCERALTLYSEALASAQKVNDSAQIYYLAINVAFMDFVCHDDSIAAQEMATLALQHAAPPGADIWKTATVAEAHLYFGRTAEALAEYRKLLTLEAEDWKHKSAALQASRIGAKLGDRKLIEELDAIFTPAARQANRIFVSYSHKDLAWLDRFGVMIKPYLREAEAELDFWDDRRLEAGQHWDSDIRQALDRAGVAVALVSADFLASSYVVDCELPAMIKAAKGGELQLLWIYVASAGWEETALKDFQATHDTKVPLAALPPAQQDEILKSVARQTKAAALGATERFKSNRTGGS
jgi:pimeloyl-ACP methyl ester carboxylesterase